MSELKMNFYHLLSDELKYELLIRGYKHLRKVDEMRAKLVSLTRNSRLAVTIDPAELNLEAELEACDSKLLDLTQLISSESQTPSQKLRIISRLIHVQSRLSRLSSEEEETSNRIGCLKKECQNAFNLLNVNIAGNTGICFTEDTCEPNSEPEHQEERGETRAAPHVPVTAAAAAAGELQITIDPTRNVSKWNIRFSGRDSKLSLHAFLERLEEFRITKNVSISELLRGISQLLEGEALEWYRFYGKECVTWEAFVRDFKEEFLPSSYNRKTIKEIYNRTQHPTESVTSYIYTMRTYFRRLDTPLPESEQIGVIKDNLAPYYKSKVFCDTFSSVAELRAKCRLLEDMKRECSNHVNPSASASGSVHPDLCYRTKGESKPNSIRKEILENTISCTKCGKVGHDKQNCKFNRKVHCYGCGKEGVIRPKCDKCAAKSPLNSQAMPQEGIS